MLAANAPRAALTSPFGPGTSSPAVNVVAVRIWFAWPRATAPPATTVAAPVASSTANTRRRFIGPSSLGHRPRSACPDYAAGAAAVWPRSAAAAAPVGAAAAVLERFDLVEAVARAEGDAGEWVV